MKTIRALWAVHSRTIPANSSKEHIQGSKEAFYGGVIATMAELSKGNDCSDEDYQAFEAGWFKEIQAFLGVNHH